jgi:hypothetical protein
MPDKHEKEVEKQNKIEASLAPGEQDNEDNVTKKGEKRYDVDTLKRPLNDDEEKLFKGMDKDEKKKFIIQRWIQENRTLDKKDMHEVSLEEEKLVGLQT